MPIAQATHHVHWADDEAGEAVTFGFRAAWGSLLNCRHTRVREHRLFGDLDVGTIRLLEGIALSKGDRPFRVCQASGKHCPFKRPFPDTINQSKSMYTVLHMYGSYVSFGAQGSKILHWAT